MPNMQDQWSYDQSTSGSSSGSSSQSRLPDWYLNAAKQSAGYFGNQLGGLNQLQGYQDPRVAELSQLQQQGIGQGGQYLNTSSPLYGQGAALMGQGANLMQGSAQYDQNQMMQHLNPYLGGALNTVSNLANQNLMENVLPGVNSTFTGAGQFGSTRNADFNNRAIRDNQQAISNTQANMVNQAYDQASNDYYRWGQQGLQAGQQMGGLGQMMGQYGITGLNTGMNLGQINQQQDQRNLDANYNTWREGYTFPLELYNQMGQGFNTSVGRLVPEQTSGSSSSNYNNRSSYNLGSGLTI